MPKQKYPWRQMKVGESILLKGKTTSSLKGCVHHLKPEMKFSFRQLVKDGERCVRVWRIA